MYISGQNRKSSPSRPVCLCRLFAGYRLLFWAICKQGIKSSFAGQTRQHCLASCCKQLSCLYGWPHFEETRWQGLYRFSEQVQSECSPLCQCTGCLKICYNASWTRWKLGHKGRQVPESTIWLGPARRIPGTYSPLGDSKLHTPCMELVKLDEGFKATLPQLSYRYSLLLCPLLRP